MVKSFGFVFAAVKELLTVFHEAESQQEFFFWFVTIKYECFDHGAEHGPTGHEHALGWADALVVHDGLETGTVF